MISLFDWFQPSGRNPKYKGKTLELETGTGKKKKNPQHSILLVLPVAARSLLALTTHGTTLYSQNAEV